jgi:hypothetical protein
MRLYGAIEKLETRDDGTVRVYGIAASEAVDEQGEIVGAAAMREALPGYMRFPALREMHQLSAAGTTLDAEVGDDGTTRIVAHVVDPVAVAKVKNQVYRGFSIGGRVTQRDTVNPKMITGLVLTEISLVDRPANPEAVFDCWKAAAVGVAFGESALCSESQSKQRISTPAVCAQAPFNSPIQIWACGLSEHRHLAKADAARCLEDRKHAPTEITTVIPPVIMDRHTAEKLPMLAAKQNPVDSEVPAADVVYADPGYQRDGKKRYPIDSEPRIRAAWGYINRRRNAEKYDADQLKRIRSAIIAAWKAKIDKIGPPAAEDGEKASRLATMKAVSDVCSLVRVLTDLEWLSDQVALAAAVENDDAPQQSRLRGMIAELCTVSNGLIADETGALVSEMGPDRRQAVAKTAAMFAMAGGPPVPAWLAAALDKGDPTTREVAVALLAQASRSQADQDMLELAYFACDKCLKYAGLLPDESECMGKARDHLCSAGAVATPASAAAEDNGAPVGYSNAGAYSRVAKVLDVIVTWLSKRDRPQQQMMDMAHECLRELTDGTMCGQAEKVGARHSRETMLELRAAHHHLVAAGARCDAADAPTEEFRPGTDLTISKRAGLGEIAKLLASEQAERAALAKLVGDMIPMLERLAKRVDEIARMPLPPRMMAKSTVSLSKQEDYGSRTAGGGADLSADAIASALAKLTKEEQTLTLIKASYANPIRVARPSADE